MSYSSDVKKELCTLECTADCCQRAEAYGLLYFSRAFGKHEISIMTDYEFVAERYKNAVYNLVRIEPTVTQTKAGKYFVSVENTEDILEILNELGYTGKETSYPLLSTNIENKCCFGAFVRGAFLACGVVTDPTKEYHLEFDVSLKNKGKYFKELFAGSDAKPKQSVRNGVNIIYFKDSSQIADVIALMGAQNSAMEFIGQTIFKNVRNNVNRKVNCDNANIKKSCDAARTQIKAITKLIDSEQYDALSPELKELAKLRLENPEMTLSELGENLSQPISRSGVNHRLQKLITLSKK